MVLCVRKKFRGRKRISTESFMTGNIVPIPRGSIAKKQESGYNSNETILQKEKHRTIY